MILKIERFATEADDDGMFYAFVLLKPTSNVIFAVLNEIEEAIEGKNTLKEKASKLHFEEFKLLEEFKDAIATETTEEDYLNKIDIESKFHFEMSGPLYLKTDETSTLDMMNFFLCNKTPFIPNSLSL